MPQYGHLRNTGLATLAGTHLGERAEPGIHAKVPVLLKWPLVMLPLLVVFLELVIDPACSVAFEAEPEESDVMERPPRNPKQPLFDRRTLTLSLLQGASVLLVVLGFTSVGCSELPQSTYGSSKCDLVGLRG